MAQNYYNNNNFLNQINDPIDNIFFEQASNMTEINKSLFDNKSQINNPSPNFQKSKSNFENSNIKEYDDKINSNFKKFNKTSQNYYNYNRNNQKKSFYNKSIGNTTPNRSFLTKSKLSINSKNNSSYKNLKRKTNTSNYNNKSTYSNLNLNLRNVSPNIKHNNNFMRKDPNKESFILNKLTTEVEHIKNYCNELQRQFDNHCLIKNEKKEFENIKKENIKLTAEVSILKDDVADLMKKFNLINNKIDSITQENNNLKMQNKNLLNFLSIISNNSNNGIRRLKSLNMNQFTNSSLLNINNNNNINNKDLLSNNSNNESMNIINLINNSKSNNINNYDINNNGSRPLPEMNNRLINNTSLKSINNNVNNTNYNFNNNLNNNLNSEQIDFSISKSISNNFEKIQDQTKDNYRTINNFDSRSNYTNIKTNENTNLESKIQQQYQTIGNMGQNNKKIRDNATDINSLIQSNFNLTNQYKNYGNNKNKQKRYLIPKSED